MTDISSRWRRKSLPALSVALLLILLLSACNGDSQMQKQADHNKVNLDIAIAHAQDIGIPNALLAPILHQEAQLGATHAPMTVFSDQPTTNYYSNLVQRYQGLTIQVQGLEQQATQQLDYQASLDLQSLESVLAQRQAQGFIEAKSFANQFKQYQSSMAQAQYPKDYLQISSNAKRTAEALHMMGPTYNQFQMLQQAIQQLQSSHLDVTALNQQEQYDLQAFRSASSPEDFARINDQINAQLQEIMAFSAQTIPYVGAAKLQELSTDIAQLKQYGQNIATYQQHLEADRTALKNAKSLSDFLQVSSQIDNDTSSIQLPLIKGQANYLLQRYHQEVDNWGNMHQYHDPYDGNNYKLDYEYNDDQGFGSDLDAAVQNAQTQDDYQAAIDLINNNMIHLKAMEANYNDKTSWDQPHNTDMQLMKHYNLTSNEVIVVSLVEQTLRFYKDGKLVNAFLITSGQYDKPSPPGLWNIFLRQSPTIFKSSEPKGSAFWYPDTNINFAMEYRDDGYYFHDSWWRLDYGPGTNFPHADSGGDVTFAGNGSHGCINMQEDQAKWLYNNSSYGASVILY